MENKPAIEGGHPVREKMLIFGQPDIGEEEIIEVSDTLRSGWIGTGPKTKKFEEIFKDLIGCKHAIALNSCTAGLALALNILNIGKDDEVITSPLTFPATANVIEHIKAKPVFVDIEKETGNIDPKLIYSKITAKTKAIIPVHYTGLPCNMDEIIKIAQEHNLRIIEDAAHAIETKYNGQKIGNIGDITSFSFYATKNVTTGEGGMITTNNDEWAKKARVLRLHGISRDAWGRHSTEGFRHYDVIHPGYKLNMMDIQAAMGLPQLRNIGTRHKRRKDIWRRYKEAFKNLDTITTPPDAEEGSIHGYHLYTLLINEEKLRVSRDEFISALQKENIGIGIHFTSLHLTKYYREKYGYQPQDFPNAKNISDRTFSIPLSSGLTDEEVSDVIKAIKKVSEFYRK